jgi:hypothetical protein
MHYGILYVHFVIYLKKKKKTRDGDVKFKIFVNFDRIRLLRL